MLLVDYRCKNNKFINYMDPQITLARHRINNKIIHIKDAKKGLGCECNCVQCEEKLLAVQGDERAWHFRHYIENDCPGGQETALHELAKEIISRNRKIQVNKKNIFEYNEVQTEKNLDSYKIDAIVKNKEGIQLIIEIAVTHFMDNKKMEYLRKNKIKSIEIDLSKIDRSIEVSELEDIIISKIDFKKVIYFKNLNDSIPKKIPKTHQKDIIKNQDEDNEDQSIDWIKVIIGLIIFVFIITGIFLIFGKKPFKKAYNLLYKKLKPF